LDTKDHTRGQQIKELLKACRHSDFKNCRFILSSRPEALPALDIPTFHLQPLTAATVSVMLSQFKLAAGRIERITRQLEAFGNRPIEPLLLAMAIETSGRDETSTNRTQLYEAYFRRLLRVDRKEALMLWWGWRDVLERLAESWLWKSGVRGKGRSHARVIDELTTSPEPSRSETLLQRLHRLYGFPEMQPIELLEALQASGILEGGRSWRFAHDTFEEYFAASSLLAGSRERTIDISVEWGMEDRPRDLVEVQSFMLEMADPESLDDLNRSDLPQWLKDFANTQSPNSARAEVSAAPTLPTEI
jgi:hypothetical protein